MLDILVGKRRSALERNRKEYGDDDKGKDERPGSNLGVLSLTPFYRDTNQSTERLTHLPKVTQPVISRAGLESSNLGPGSVLLAMTTYSHLAGL